MFESRVDEPAPVEPVMAEPQRFGAGDVETSIGGADSSGRLTCAMRATVFETMTSTPPEWAVRPIIVAPADIDAQLACALVKLPDKPWLRHHQRVHRVVLHAEKRYGHTTEDPLGNGFGGSSDPLNRRYSPRMSTSRMTCPT